jgi:trans-aconitate 2-methyltransferase
MTSDWDPQLYRRFESERTRPALDLLMHVPLSTPSFVVDVGCGPGNSTELLCQRFPDARVVGIDSSAAMVHSARERLPKCQFEVADVSTWQPSSTPDLIFANAVLQWLPDHEALLPRLFGLLAPGGVFALQMPDNLEEPTHRAMREVAADARFASTIGDVGKLRARILTVQRYYDLLSGNAAQVDLWRTTYQHPMSSPAAIVDWLRATGLRPFLEPLSTEQRELFLKEYERRIDDAYPARADGQRLLGFPRLCMIAQRRT